MSRPAPITGMKGWGEHFSAPQALRRIGLDHGLWLIKRLDGNKAHMACKVPNQFAISLRHAAAAMLGVDLLVTPFERNEFLCPPLHRGAAMTQPMERRSPKERAYQRQFNEARAPADRFF